LAGGASAAAAVASGGHQSLLQHVGMQSSGAQHHYTSLSASNSCASDTGSWGKHFYMNYDVCPLGLDELGAYFQTDHCEELICERFMIKDLILHSTACTTEASTTISEHQQQQQGDATSAGDDDAGHHSGRLYYLH